jgi:hypothetical protein
MTGTTIKTNVSRYNTIIHSFCINGNIELFFFRQNNNKSTKNMPYKCPFTNIVGGFFEHAPQYPTAIGAPAAEIRKTVFGTIFAMKYTETQIY